MAGSGPIADGTPNPTERSRRRRDPKTTRAAIVDASLALVIRHRRVPTAKEVAAEAGVSERTVFVHFIDLEELRRAVTLRQSERWRALARPIDPRLPLADRIGDLLTQRQEMYELMAPVRRVGLSEESKSEAVAKVMADGDAWFRQNVADVFAPEAEAHTGAGRPGGLLDAVNAAVGWASWDHLRHRRGLTAEETRAALTTTLQALLG